MNGFIKADGQNWVMKAISEQAKAAGVQHHTRVIMGNVDLRVSKWINDGVDFYYLDHSYFQRGWDKGHFRAIRGALHLNKMKKRPDDRLRKFGVKVEPWRKKRGNSILMIPTYATHHAIYRDLDRWNSEMAYRIKKVTGRQIIVKKKGSAPLKAYFDDAWALVCNGSVAGVEAALAGIPVFAGPLCCAAPISAGPVENIENPELVDFRHEWAAGLSYASWHQSEIGSINWLDYDYELRHDLQR